jgi:hypothetical protein
MEHGRYLSGFGSASPSGATGYDPAYQDQHVYELEGQDDVYGSGIFDPKGRAGTANPDLGVFASHDSLPGYIAREVPFTVSRDVTDITDDADVVIVPGGGMSYIAPTASVTGPAVLGPTWRPPEIQPAGWTRYDQTYAFMNKAGQKGTVLNPNAPVKGPPLYRPRRTSPDTEVGVPMVPRGDVMVPFRRQATRVPYQSQVDPFVYTAPANPVTGPTVAQSSPDLPAGFQVPPQSIVNTDVQFAPAHPVPPPHVAAAAPDLPQRQVMPLVSTVRPMAGLGSNGGMWPARYRFPTSDPIVPAQYPTHGGVFGVDPQVCPEGQINASDGSCVTPEPEADKAQATPIQLAVAGALIGGTVGLIWNMTSGRKRD